MPQLFRSERHHVVVAGGGVAAVEALLALRAIAGAHVQLTLIAPQPDFLARAASVAAPFGLGAPPRIPLEAIAERLDADLRRGALTGVRPEGRVALVDDHGAIAYDSLVVAVGARARTAVPRALSFTGADAVPAFAGMLDAAQRGELRDLVIAVPEGAAWTLPAYELAIMAAVELRSRGAAAARITLVTHERTPVELFGADAGLALAEMLALRGIRFVSAVPLAAGAGELLLRHADPIRADAVVALPVPQGPALRGLPTDADGFLPVDEHGRVKGVQHVYAAGDATAFPLKQGGLATQQADAVAEAIAAGLGALAEPTPFVPVLRGLLLTGGAPLYLRAELDHTGRVAHTGARRTGTPAAVSGHALWWPPAKVAGRYLAPFLATARPRALADEPLVDRVATPARPSDDDRADALALALAMAEEDARLGDFRQAVHALDAAAALNGGVLPARFAAERARWAREGAPA
jgi:sulfide:quinone oxidoreductase